MLAIDVSLLLLMLSQTRVEVSYSTIESTYSEHTQAVKKARSGDHQGGLLILQRLLQHFPNDYSLQRDYVIVTAWSGDCKKAIKRFHRIKNSKKHKGYFLAQVGECMVKQERYHDAIALLRKANRKYPDNKDIKYYLLQAKIRLASTLPSGTETKSYVRLNESDQGRPEWFLGNETSFHVTNKTRVYVNYLISRTNDSTLKAGEQDRIGVGIRYRPNLHVILEQGISRDTGQSGQGGSFSRVQFMPSDTWHYEFFYNTFAIDIPIRAKAGGIEADHTAAKVTHDIDEAWYWHVSLNRLRFTDNNTREYLYGEYGILLKQGAERNHRLVLEYYQSHNSLVNAVYFNPSRDQSTNVVYELEFLFPESRFKDHQDQLKFSLGSYKQKDFGSHGTWGIAYGQKYELSESISFSYEFGYENNVYDGQRESERIFEARLKIKL